MGELVWWLIVIYFSICFGRSQWERVENGLKSFVVPGFVFNRHKKGVWLFCLGVIEVLVSTTPTIEGKRIVKYLGLVSGEAVMGANIFKDVFAGIRDIIGGRSAAYEKELKKAKEIAIKEMVEQATELGANAVVSVDLDYETIGQSMLMVSASGTAVVIE